MGNHLINKYVANWNILVAIGKEINIDIVSSDERKLYSLKNLSLRFKSTEGNKSPV